MSALSFRLALLAGLILATTTLGRPAPPAIPAARLDAHGDALPEGALARFGTARFRVGGYWSTPTLSPDGKQVAVAHEGIQLLDTTTGKVLRHIPADHYVRSLRFSSDGKLLAIAGYKEVAIRDLVKGERTASVQLGGRLGGGGISFSADGKLLAVDEEDDREKLSVLLYDVAARKEVKKIPMPQTRRVIPVLSPDGKVLATWGEMESRREKEPGIQLWDVASCKELRKLPIDRWDASVLFSPDSKHLAVAGPGVVSIYAVATGQREVQFITRKRTAAAMCYSADGKLLATGSPDGAIQLWDLRAGRRVGLCAAPPRTRLTSIVVLPGNKVLAAGIRGASVRIWEVPSGRERTPKGGHDSSVAALAFSRDGKTLLSSCANEVRVWEIATGKQLRRIEPRREEDTLFDEIAGLLSPGGRYLVWASRHGGDPHVIKMASGEEIMTLGRSNHDGHAVVFAEDRGVVAGLDLRRSRKGWSLDIGVWDLDAGRELRRIKSPGLPDGALLALSPRAKTLAGVLGARDSSQLFHWNLADGKEIARYSFHSLVKSLSFSPEGDVLAIAVAEGTIRFHDALTGDLLYKVEEETPGIRPGVLAFSPDGRTIAIAQNNLHRESSVDLWELASGKVRARFVGHRGAAMSLAFSPDGRTLATGGADTTILLWDVTGRTGLPQQKGKPTPANLASWWADLGSPDAIKAHQAAARLLAAPQQTLKLLHKELKPAMAKRLDEKEVQRMIADLGADSFEVREKASRDLRQAGHGVRQALIAALKVSPDLEKKRRLEELLRALRPGPSPKTARQTRAVEILERIGTAEAQRLLSALAGGNRDARLTSEAAAALRRLRRGR
jgi:WD40 repeat protein